LKGQEYPTFQFKKIQVDDGLSQNAVYCILQDSKGFMWFGTKDGLNRYDGSNFRIYRHESSNPLSLGNNFIRNILEFNEQTLYIGTDEGLYIMNTIDETFVMIKEKTNDGTHIMSGITALYLDSNKNVWIGTMYQGIFIYDTSEKVLKKIELSKYELGFNATWSIMCDKSGTIWAGTKLGLLRFNNKIRKFECIDSLFNTNEFGYEIMTIKEDNNGNLWLGTRERGIWKYNKHSDNIETYLFRNSDYYYPTYIRFIYDYTEKIFLVGSEDGLYLFDIETTKLTRVDVPQLKNSLSDQNAYSIVKDKEGGIWIGTYLGGINYLNTSLLNVESYNPDTMFGSLKGKAVSQFCEDEKGNLWIATEDGGVNYLNTKTNIISQPIKTTYHNIHSLLLDNENLWIGTFSRGIDIYNRKSGTLSNIRNNSSDDNCIFSLYKTKAGDIYAGTLVGLSKFDKQKSKFSQVPEASRFIYDMKEDEFGNLWLATFIGAMKFDANQEKWIHYDTIQPPEHPIVKSKLTSVYIDTQKRIIFTSEGRGIFIYDYETNSFNNISEADGLPNDVIYGVLDDPYGNLWLSCNKGLICFNPANPKSYKLYSKDDNLQSNQFNYKSSYKTADGKFYFGGINGFNSFYPNDLSSQKNSIVPPVIITQIQLLNNSDEDLEQSIRTNLNAKEKIRLPYNKSSFILSYVSLSYVSQKKNQYAYKMEGKDFDWNYVGNNKSVTYVDLAPGKYLFKVKASNNDGIWNETGTEVEIEILPPFWLSWPAKVFYIIVILAILYLLVLYLITKNKQKQVQQLESYKTEQETLAFKSKIDFFTTIAHEIRTPLSLISAPLEEVVASGEGSMQTKENLYIIEKNCDRLNILINQLLDFRKMDSTQYVINPVSINLKAFVEELYKRFKKTAEKRGINFELNFVGGDDWEIFSDIDALTKIIGNLLTNAFKYAKDKVMLTVIINKDYSFTINVEDNGKGISQENKNLIFDPFYQVDSNDINIGTGIGLSLVKHLVGILGGNIEVIDSETGGSIFIFKFSDIPHLENNDSRNIEKEEELFIYKEPSQTINKKGNILIVDDNPDMISFIKNCLQNDYSPYTALNTDEAFVLLEKNSYDLIITDIMMPGTDGISFTKILKENINYSHIPVILLSAKTDISTKVEGLRSGADVFIEKPFSTAYIKAQILSLLENRRTLLEVFNRSPLASYSTLVSNKSDEIFLQKLNEGIEKNISDEKFSLEGLSELVGMSRSNLQRKLKSISGVTPGDYLRNYRLKRACKLLIETDMRINEVAFLVGFNSASYFTKSFYKAYNMSPKEFINKQKGNLS